MMVSQAEQYESDYPCHPGDVIVCSGTDPISRSIRILTCSPWSHAAITAWVTRENLSHFFPERDWKDWKPKTLLFESTADKILPCSISGKKQAGLQSHGVLKWVAWYPGKVYRMQFLSKFHGREQERLTDCLLARLKKQIPYDTSGALLAGTRVVKWFPCLAEKIGDRQSSFCIETIESVIQAAFVARSLPSFDPGRDRPRDLVRKLKSSSLWSKPQRLK